MYGLVNKAIQRLVIKKFGEQTWSQIKEKAGVKEVQFLSIEVYDDKLTYELVGAIAHKLDVDPPAVLELFGEYWVEYVKEEGYEVLLLASGNSLEEFLAHLDTFHSRLAITFPNFKPPQFSFVKEEDGTMVLSYYSERPGLAPMMVGILRGMAKRYGDEIEVEMVEFDERTDFRVTVLESSSVMVDPS